MADSKMWRGLKPNKAKIVFERNLSVLDATREFEEKDFRMLVKAVHEVFAKWENIGVCLSIPAQIMDNLGHKWRRNAVRGMISILDDWVKGHHGVEALHPCWHSLVYVVADAIGGGNPAAANNIAKNWKEYEINPFFYYPKAKEADSSPLDEIVHQQTQIPNDLYRDFLHKVNAHWFEIGVLLGVPIHELEVLEQEDEFTVKPMIRVIERWIHLSLEIDYLPPPTLQVLSDAVANKMGGNNPGLAKKLIGVPGVPQEFSDSMSPDQLYPWLVGIPGVPQEFSDSMSPDQLYPWLLSNQLPENDCKLIKDDNKGGIAFKCIHEDDLIKLGVSAAGLTIINRLKERIGTIQHREACDKAMNEMLTVFIRVVRLNFIGLPRSGKTSLLLRLMEVIKNIQAEKERLISKNLESDNAGGIPKEQPSTGLAESCGQVFIKKCVSHKIGTISSKKWSILKDLRREGNMLIQLIYNSIISPTHSNKQPIQTSSNSSQADSEEAKLKASEDVSRSEVKGASQSESIASDDTSLSEEDQHHITDDILSLISDAISREDTDLQKLLDYMILLINTDTGGQAEFLDLHSSLVDGPSLNLLFHRLQDDLHSVFETYYTYDDGSSTRPVESRLTVEEVLFQALSSIACFSGCFLEDKNPQEKDSIQSKVNQSKSKVMFVGTHRDEVPDEADFIKKDDALKMKIEDTKFFDKNIIKYADNSKGQLMFSVNNKTGDENEISKIRGRLEEVIEKNFEKIAIPVAWLVLSLYIRSQKWRTLSYGKCERIAGCLNIKSEDLQHVLWFFHHCIGVHLYYPDILGDTLICDVQVVFDSASNLIKYIYELDDQPAQKQFREKAQFSLEDMKNATVKCTDDLIPLQKLVKLLEHLGMLTIIPSEADEEQKYFMPCVLKSATGQELKIPTLSNSDPAPLILRFFSGYVPMGLFPAMITKLVSPQRKGWELVCDKKQGLWKNKVQFRITFGMQRYIVFLLSNPYYIKIAICHKSSVTSPLCAHVRSVIESVMKEIIKHQCLNDLCEYGFEKECPQGLEEADHLCIFVKKPEILDMVCFRTECQEEVQLEKKHKIWFPPPIPQNETLSDYEGLPPRKRTRIEEGQSSDYYYQTDVDTDGFISSHSRNTVPGDPEPWSKEGKRKGSKLRSKESILEKARPGPIQHPVLSAVPGTTRQYQQPQAQSLSNNGQYQQHLQSAAPHRLNAGPSYQQPPSPGQQSPHTHHQQTGLQWQQGGLDPGATQGPPPSNWQQQNRPPLNAGTVQGVGHIPHQQVYHNQLPTGQQPPLNTGPLYPQNTGGGAPTLGELLSFFSADGARVNFGAEITGVDCSTVCTLLLEDDNGARFSAIEDECLKNAEKMNRKIFISWLNGKGKQPVTWSTFVDVLRGANLNRLANIIEASKL